MSAVANAGQLQGDFHSAIAARIADAWNFAREQGMTVEAAAEALQRSPQDIRLLLQCGPASSIKDLGDLARLLGTSLQVRLAA